jgi:hypothetical protein
MIPLIVWLARPAGYDAKRRPPVPFQHLYYTMGDSLRVIALAHHRRKPQYWSGRT